MKKQTHVHRLKKHKYPKTGNAIFFCTLPDCHFKIDAPLAVGKRSICNMCGSEFIMTESSLKLLRPHCIDCGKVKVKDADGKTRYIKKVSNKVLVGVAMDSQQDLRSRLENITNTDSEDDI